MTFSLFCGQFIFTKILSVQLQSPRQNVSNAFSQEERKNLDEEFNKYFLNASEMLDEEERKIPRVCALQTKKSNIEIFNQKNST